MRQKPRRGAHRPSLTFTRMTWLRSIFYPLAGLAVLQSIYYYPKMPSVVASHFDGLGAANGWSGKGAFFVLYLTIVLLLIGVFEWLPKWVESRPNKHLKIPNREYWMSPERRVTTWAFFRRQMMLMGIANLCLAIFVIQLAILANFEQPPRLHSSVTWALGTYFTFFVAWLIHFMLRFKKP